MAELVRQGYEVFAPMFGNTYCDLVVCKDKVLKRVEVKSVSYKEGPSYRVQLAQVRPNRTENVKKKFDSSNSDILAVYIVPENRVVLLHSSEHNGKSSVAVK